MDPVVLIAAAAAAYFFLSPQPVGFAAPPSGAGLEGELAGASNGGESKIKAIRPYTGTVPGPITRIASVPSVYRDPLTFPGGAQSTPVVLQGAATTLGGRQVIPPAGTSGDAGLAALSKPPAIATPLPKSTARTTTVTRTTSLRNTSFDVDAVPETRW